MAASKEEEEGSYHFSFKVAICGDTGVGKTTLLEGEGASSYNRVSSDSSVGINFRVKFYEVEGKTYRVQYWDCPGAERYMKLTSRYCAGSAGALFVFDGTCVSTVLFRMLNCSFPCICIFYCLHLRGVSLVFYICLPEG